MVISHILDTRRPGKDGLFPVKVRISYNKKADYIPTGHRLTKPVYDNLTTPNVTSSQEPARDEIITFVARVKAIVSKLQVYSLESLRNMIAVPDPGELVPKQNDILVWFEYKAKDCIETRDSYGNAMAYREAATFYKKYFNLEQIPFELITPAKLLEIQKVKAVKYSLSSIGMYSRHLRSIFNLAIAKEFIKSSLYPFGMHKYVPPTSRKRKHALSREAMGALLSYEPVTPEEQFYLDLFFFSFFGNGLNLKDVATLRWRDMGKYHITKMREKTINKSGQEPIIIVLGDELRAIIKRQGNKNKDQDNYIFPLVKKSDSNEQIFYKLRSLRSVIRNGLTRIGKRLGIEGDIPHGTSRHCFANAMKQGGASAELISETIGHSSVSVTKHYTSSFEEEGLDYQKYLLAYTRKK